MTPHTLNNYSVLIPDIPEGATDVKIGGTCLICNKAGLWHCAHADTCGNTLPALKVYNGEKFLQSITLPPGDWQLYRLSEVPEELAGEMVEEDEFAYWKTYTEKNMFWESTAHASFVSWVRAQGVEGDPYLLIKKND